MATSAKALLLILASAICFLSFLRVSVAADGRAFHVRGQVYCDTCHFQFPTKLSKFLKGAKVRLECKDRGGNYPTYSVDGLTNEEGYYRLKVEGDHEDELCEIILVDSGDKSCSKVPEGKYHKDTARISITENNGMANDERKANPLGFLVDKPDKEKCSNLLKEMGIPPEEIETIDQ